MSHVDAKGTVPYSTQREQPVQRSSGRTVPSMFEEQQGGLWDCSRVNKRERGGRRGQGGDEDK